MTMKNEKRKVWVFFLLKDASYDGVKMNGIYAFTDSKELAKNFRETRSMKLFYEKKYMMDPIEHSQLLHDKMLRELRMVDCGTKTKDYKAVSFRIALTAKEENVLRAEETDFSYNLLTSKTFDPSIFTYEYRRALDTLLFTALYHYNQADDYSDDASDILSECFGIDEFACLMALYGDLFVDPREEGDEFS